ncbi:MAG TPA: trypsin-like peptidase domain-containing protein [Allosphingosinicella sp.]|jgi:S1-C subfamily serine protease|uniref:trypsin-like peptidase domain-containing protein n=1 Tax=Allosphingosinicella sp. TaxID=2823234 RepID=UPI002F29E76B
MRDLVAGERAAVDEELSLGLLEPLRPPLMLALVALDRSRKASRAFEPIDSANREMRPAARFEEGGRLSLWLGQMPGEVDRLAIVAFLASGPGGGLSFRDYGALTLLGGSVRFRVDLNDRPDTALILAELYRHGGGWRLAANGGGSVQGLAGVAEAFAIEGGWARRLLHAPATRDEVGPERGRVGSQSSGSGVAVDARHVLSNAHVVEEAKGIAVLGDGRSQAAELVFADPRNDLALLRVEQPLPALARFRAGLDLHLGEDVVALGFPLQGLLGSGPQASAGNIAGLCGIGNDSSVFQFTAPIASGNSGGPIFDNSGHLLGLVCSSLNIDRIRAAGGNAENINFGVKGAIVRSFLDAFGIEPQLAGPSAPIGRAEMVRQARATIYRIGCTC